MAACRVAFTWWGTQKTLTPEQRALAAEAFDAEGAVPLRRQEADRHEALRLPRRHGDPHEDHRDLEGPVAAVPRAGRPADQAGARSRRSRRSWPTIRVELDDAVANLDAHYAELRQAAAVRLGCLFHSGDYPETLVGLFDVQWDFPSIEPPDYLMQLSPALYEAERARMEARFEEAVRLAEEAFTEEFARLVEHLAERISGTGDDGQPKVFRDCAVDNLAEFFERFGELNVRSNAQLDALVERAQAIVRGIGPQDLRESPPLRQRVATGLSQVQSALDGLLVDRPRRRILRSASASATGEA